MVIKRAWWVLALAVSAPLAAAGCKKPPAQAAPIKVKSYPDTVEGLKQFFVDMTAAQSMSPALADKMAEGLMLPDEWFPKHFDPETSMRLTTEYRTEVHPEALPKQARKLFDEGKTEVLVERFESPDDKKMNGFESFALRAAKEKYVAYSVRLTQPGKRSGFHVYTVVYVDGSFRLVGKMKTANPKPLGEQNEALFELRRADVETFMTTGSFPED